MLEWNQVSMQTQNLLCQIYFRIFFTLIRILGHFLKRLFFFGDLFLWEKILLTTFIRIFYMELIDLSLTWKNIENIW